VQAYLIPNSMEPRHWYSSSAKMSAIDASLAKIGELTLCRPATGPHHLVIHSIALCHHVIGIIAAALPVVT